MHFYVFFPSFSSYFHIGLVVNLLFIFCSVIMLPMALDWLLPYPSSLFFCLLILFLVWTGGDPENALIKKKIKFSSYIRKFRWDRLQSHIWPTASSYIVEYFRISSYIRKPFLIYAFATADPIWISLYKRKKVRFLFISVAAGRVKFWPSKWWVSVSNRCHVFRVTPLHRCVGTLMIFFVQKSTRF